MDASEIGKYDVFSNDEGGFDIYRGNAKVGFTDGWGRMLDFFRERVENSEVPASTLVGLHIGRLGYAEMQISTMAELR